MDNGLNAIECRPQRLSIEKIRQVHDTYRVSDIGGDRTHVGATRYNDFLSASDK
jgi:hypothetical protein